MRVEPVIYDAVTKTGCFERMLNDTAYDDCLFLYNENVEDWIDWDDSTAGAGSAKVRPFSWSYHQDKPPRVLGIPTGFSSPSKGFKEIDRDARYAIGIAIRRIVLLLRKNKHIERLIYSADPIDTKVLGTSVFKLPDQVLQYISNAIWRIPELVEDTSFDIRDLAVLRRQELELLPRVKLEKECALLRMRSAGGSSLRPISSRSEQVTPSMRFSPYAFSARSGSGTRPYQQVGIRRFMY